MKTLQVSSSPKLVAVVKAAFLAVIAAHDAAMDGHRQRPNAAGDVATFFPLRAGAELARPLNAHVGH